MSGRGKVYVLVLKDSTMCLMMTFLLRISILGDLAMERDGLAQEQQCCALFDDCMIEHFCLFGVGC